ncbi:hypothetical protein O181_041750 [Austropuccinia psidii MF-1]|uniref:Uncharacterized protein n=1 Tax=Austropuccinia psidii MF-1 TaxID=1389203 RepID=A0A9Q3DFG0_9BASI|nr:hypothetical protein [Austropuccinia psidii MF-1]
MSERDTLERPYGNHQRLESTRKFRLLKERASRIRESQATIIAIGEKLNQTGPTLIPSGSQVVDQPSSPVASHHSGTSR